MPETYATVNLITRDRLAGLATKTELRARLDNPPATQAGGRRFAIPPYKLRKAARLDYGIKIPYIISVGVFVETN